jgi:hypothetical protein
MRFLKHTVSSFHCRYNKPDYKQPYFTKAVDAMLSQYGQWTNGLWDMDTLNKIRQYRSNQPLNLGSQLQSRNSKLI